MTNHKLERLQLRLYGVREEQRLAHQRLLEATRLGNNLGELRALFVLWTERLERAEDLYIIEVVNSTKQAD